MTLPLLLSSLHSLPEMFSDVPVYHIYLEVFLALLVLWVICKKSSDPGERLQLSLEEKEKVINEWKPEPLVKEAPNKKHRSLSPKIVNGKVGKNIDVDGYMCLNLATHNYLGFVENKDVEDQAIKSVMKYGVGSCGPRGFYGTVDVHLDLEEKIAKFMNMEETVVYAYGFSTISSSIPAYAKRGDIIFVDENVNFAIQKGLQASRSEIKYFKHNDVNDLNNLLQQQSVTDAKDPKRAEKTRKFLIVEGIYMNSGDICCLPELIQLRKKYKLRIFIDESISFGTLGHTGRGVTEYFNIPIIEVDLITGSLEWAIGSIGGFCVGSSFIVEHQRLSGLGYCFSASLPPLLTSAAITALDVLEKHPQTVQDLQKICELTHNSILQSKLMENFELLGLPISPVKHLTVKSSTLSLKEKINILETTVNFSMKNGVALITASYLEDDKYQGPPSIRLTVNALLTLNDIMFAISVIESAIMFTNFK